MMQNVSPRNSKELGAQRCPVINLDIRRYNAKIVGPLLSLSHTSNLSVFAIKVLILITQIFKHYNARTESTSILSFHDPE